MRSITARTKKIFLLSNYSEYDRKKITNMIHALGGSTTELCDYFSATHLVVPYFKTTPKMVAALAAGLWIVQTSYVYRSYRSGYWEHEAAYEIGSSSCPYYFLNENDVDFKSDVNNDSPRICREMALVKRKPNLSNWKVGLVMDDPEEFFNTKWVLKAGGALVKTYKWPIRIDDIDEKSVDFVVVSVRDLSSMKPLLNRNITCVPYEFVADSLCKDPPPDISHYDLQNWEEKEMIIPNITRRRSTSSYDTLRRQTEKRPEDWLSTPIKTKIVAKDETMHFHGEDKIKITVNKPCNCSKFTVNSKLFLNLNILANVELENKTCKSVVSDVNGKKLNVESCNLSDEVKMQNNIGDCTVSQDKFLTMGIRKESLSAGRPSKKRLLSHKYVSPGKRKKTYPQQTNTMLNYLTCDANETKSEKMFGGSENVSDNTGAYIKHPSEKAGNVLHANNSCPSCSQRFSDRGQCKCNKYDHPDLIVLSSDEDSGSSLSYGSQFLSEGESKTFTDLSMKPPGDLKWKNYEQPKSHINLCYVDHKENVFKKESINSSECTQVITISSDEDEDSPDGVSSKVIDLTCDDNDDDDDVYVYEHSVSGKRTYCDNKKEVNQNTISSEIALQSTRRAFPEHDTKNSLHIKCSSEKYSQILDSNELERRSDVLENNGVEHSCLVDADEDMNSRVNCADQHFRSELFNSNYSNNDTNSGDFENLSDSELPLPPSIPCIESPSVIENVKSSSQEDDVKIDEEVSLPAQCKSNMEGARNTLFNEEDKAYETEISNSLSAYSDVNLHSVSTKIIEKILEVDMTYEEATSSGKIELNTLPHSKTIFPIMDDGQISHNLSDTEKEQFYESNSDIKDNNATIAYLSDSDKSAISKQAPSRVRGGNSSKVKCVTAEEICSVLADVLSAKILHPWIELGAFYTPPCVLRRAVDCSRSHAEKIISSEQELFDENFLLEAVCPSSAIELLQRRIDVGKYPSSSLVQHALFCIMEQWSEIGVDAILSLNHLLHMHPPCAHGMLDYYKKVFFSPFETTKVASKDGVFWYCLTKIEQSITNLKCQARNPVYTPNQPHVREESLENIIFPSINRTNRGSPGHLETAKLELLFNCLDYFNDVFEADLYVGLSKNLIYPKRYISRNAKPLIAQALWGNQIIGPANHKCKQLIKLYFLCIEHFSTKMFSLSLNRLVSMMAALVYASERNTQPPKYPNVGSNCKDFSCVFSSILMSSDLNLNMADVASMLNSLKPDWFRWSVCCSLLEKLYGRNMDLALQPVISLLKHLWAVNQELPSTEIVSNLLIAETENESAVKRSCYEVSGPRMKNATKKDKKGETRLHVTCRVNRYTEVEDLLTIPNININEKDNLGWTPLHEASFHGSIECIKLLLHHRTASGGPAVDLRAKNIEGVTPLMDAVLRNHLDVAELLLEYGGRELLLDINDKGNSARNLAHTEEMKKILNNAPDSSKFNALSSIPIQLRLKLVILVPQLILFYIKFSEVKKITSCLVQTEVDSISPGFTSIKFKPLTYKQDYKELKALQSLVKQMLTSNFGLVDKLIFLL